MLVRSQLFPLNFYKKERFNGSMGKMNYRLKKTGDETFTGYTWEGPYCFDVTPEEKMITKEFPFTEEGINAAVDWFNESQRKYNGLE